MISFFQINEIGMRGISEFMSGSIYVYGKIENENIENHFCCILGVFLIF